jgi:uncharacterized membrane protein
MLPAYPTPPVRDPRVVAFIIAVDRAVYAVARRWLIAVNAIFLAWIALATLAPVLMAAGYAAPSRFIYAVFQPFCHQRPDRSFHILGEKMACCERCAAIYGGFFLFGLGYVAIGRRRRLPWRGLALLSLPVLLDAATQAAGFRESSAFWRVTTGALFAFGLAWILFPYLDAGFADMRAKLETRFARLVAQGRARPLRGAPPPALPQT